ALGPSLTLAQKGGKKGGGFGGAGGGFQGGGFQGGGGIAGGGFGGGFGTKTNIRTDPNSLFDFYSKGRNYFLVSESGGLAGALSQYMQAKGNTSGQVTRDMFSSFYAEMSSGMAGRGFPGQGGGGMTK